MFFNFSALSTIYVLMIPKFTHLQLRPFFQTPKSHIQFPTQHLQLNVLWASQTQNVQIVLLFAFKLAQPTAFPITADGPMILPIAQTFDLSWTPFLHSPTFNLWASPTGSLLS